MPRKNCKDIKTFDVDNSLVVYDQVGKEQIDGYAAFPCYIRSCNLVYVIQGNIRAEIYRGEYDITAGDFIVLLPGSYLRITDVSDDALISLECYSSDFLKKVNFWRIVLPVIHQVLINPVFRLNKEMGDFYRNSFTIMTGVSRMSPSFMTQNIAKSAFVVAFDMLINAINSNMVLGLDHHRVSSRDQEIVAGFMRNAVENYRREHKITFYARQAGLSLSHFCNVVSKTTGMTAQQIIKNLLIMDAKTQLNATDRAVGDIARDLGFASPTIFIRYFKTYTSMTPQEYRSQG